MRIASSHGQAIDLLDNCPAISCGRYLRCVLSFLRVAGDALVRFGGIMLSPADLDESNVVDIDLGSAEFKVNAHRHMAEWARRDTASRR